MLHCLYWRGARPPPLAGGGRMFMYCAYILQSLKNEKYYIGSTTDIVKRLERHNKGQNKSTRSGIPWKIVYQESFPSRNEAY
ncbi:MAG: GIY-YIG nuclease family protein [Candidatus Paceibacterota bacterium]